MAALSARALSLGRIFILALSFSYVTAQAQVSVHPVVETFPVLKYYDSPTSLYHEESIDLTAINSFLDSAPECLTTDQKKDLVFSVKIVQDLLNTAATSLTSYADLTDDASLAVELRSVAAVINKVNLDIVQHLTSLVKEACGSCIDLVHFVEDAVEVIQNALADILPSLKTNVFFDSAVTAVTSVLKIVEDICDERNTPSLELIFLDFESSSSCLTPEQKNDINEVFQLLGNVLNTFSQWIRESEDKAHTKLLKDVIDKIADLLADARDDVENKGEQLLENVCEGCSKTAELTYKYIHMTEKAMDLVLPLWRKIPGLNQAAQKIDQLLHTLKSVCPYEYNLKELYMLEIEGQDDGYKAQSEVDAQIQSFLKQMVTSMEVESQVGSQELSVEERKSLIAGVADFKIMSENWKGLDKPEVGCAEILHFYEGALHEIEHLMDHYLPMWKMLPIYYFYDHLIRFMLHTMERFCPHADLVLLPLLPESNNGQCFDGEAFQTFKKASRSFDRVIETVEEGLEIVKDNMKFPGALVVKGTFHEVLMLLEKVKKVIRMEFREVSSVTCELCSKLEAESENILDQFESFLDKDVPKWKDLELIKNFVRLLRGVVSSIHTLCGDKISSNSVECSSDDAIADINSIVHIIDDFLVETSKLASEVSEKVDQEKAKQFLDDYASVALKEKAWLDENAVNAVENSCEKCIKYATVVSELATKTKEGLSVVFPWWNKIPQVKALVNKFDSVMDEVNTFCPFEGTLLKLNSASFSGGFCAQLPPGVNFADVIGNLQTEINRNLADLEATAQRSQMLRASVWNPTSSLVFVFESDAFANGGVCLSCASLVESAENVVNKIEAFLTRVFPEWQEIPLMPQVDNLVHMLLDEVHSLCPKFNLKPSLLLTKSSYKCLTSDEQEKLNYVLKLITKSFDEVDNSLDQVKDLLEDDKVQEIVDRLKSTVDSIEEKVKGFIVETSQNICVDCEKFGKAAADKINEFKNTLDVMLPNWNQIAPIKKIIQELEDALDLIKVYCPFKSTSVYESSTEVIPQVIPCNLVLEVDGCLDDKEKATLQNITRIMHVGLDFAADMIHVASEFEINPLKKMTEQTAARLVKAVSKDIVTNLTRLADEFCGSCGDLTVAVRDTILVLEAALFDVEPMWKKTPIYSGVKAVTKDVFENLKRLCKEKKDVVEFVYLKDDKPSCLTPSEKQSLAYYTDKADQLLSYGSQTLESLANEMGSGVVHDQLLNAAKIVKSVDADLVRKINVIANEPCTSCLDIVGILKDAKNSIEKALTDIDPEWRTNSKYAEIAFALDSVVTLMESLCPSEMGFVGLAAPVVGFKECDLSADELAVAQKLVAAELLKIKFENQLNGYRNIQLARYEEEVSKFAQKPCFNREMFLDFLAQSPGFTSNVLPITSYMPKCTQEKSEYSETLVHVVLRSLESFEQALEKAGEEETNFEAGRFLRIQKELVQLMHQNVEENLHLVLSQQPCGACGAIMEGLNEAVEEVKKLIIEIVPSLENNNILKTVVDGVESLLDMIHNFCPQDMVVFNEPKKYIHPSLFIESNSRLMGVEV